MLRPQPPVRAPPALGPPKTYRNVFVVSLRSLLGVDEARVLTCTNAKPPHALTPGKAVSGTFASANSNLGISGESTQFPLLFTYPHGAGATAVLFIDVTTPAGGACSA